MKALKADPESISKLFTDTYLIPDYQRPYTWDKEECEQLWQDIITFNFEQGVDKNMMEDYFLGCITVHESQSDYTFAVIDGQQRLLTLSLLIKALFQKFSDNEGLRACLCQVDINTREIDVNKPRIKSEVIDENNKEFKEIIINNNPDNNTKLGRNYELFKERIEEWHNEDPNNTERNSGLVSTLLSNIQMLRIKADSEDDALLIFETINDRGTPLNATDIFKARLHSNTSTEEGKSEFINNWKELNDTQYLFSLYMRILRAKKEDRDTTTPKLKKYFLEGQDGYLSDPTKVMEDINKIHDISECNWNMPKDVMQWWKVIEQFPNAWWQYPLYIFLFKNMNKTLKDKRWDVSDFIEDFRVLIKETLRYVAIRGVHYRSINSIRSTILNVCVDIYKGDKNYLNIYQKATDDNDGKRFKESIDNHNKLGRYQKILVYLNSCLFEIDNAGGEKNSSFYDQVDQKKIEIEHILPKKWNHYDGWNAESHANNINRLGNLMLLTKKVNIKASNEFFQRKKDVYETSSFSEAQVISQSKSINWGPDELEERDEIVKERLFKFLRI